MGSIVKLPEKQFNVQNIAKVRSKNFEKHERYETNIPKFPFNVKVKMTLTFILEVFCKRNLFVFERHCNGVNEDKAQRQYDNRLRNNKLKYEKNDTI